jgi:predicted GH43/DUF377 family glycosyl hydrolase
MIEIPNWQLAGYLRSCFNPALVNYQGRRLLFYRYTAWWLGTRTRIAMVELDADFRPASRHAPVSLPKVSDRVITFDDPRAIVWRDQLWLLHIQAAYYAPGWTWSSAIVLNQVSPAGEVLQTHVPAYGRNLNYAVTEAPPAFEKNWTPIVVDNELYVVYELNPLTVIQFHPASQTWVPVAQQPWTSPYTRYLSGGTPLIPWQGTEYIGLFHTYEKRPHSQSRIYSMGFYTVDVAHWRVTRVSAQPILTAWDDRCRDIRRGNYLRLLPNRRQDPPYSVVFPCGILDCDSAWAVAIGWNDCRTYIEIYDKTTVTASLLPVPA